MTYYLIIALQIGCGYHVVKTRNSFYWFLPILILPVVGCLIYILTQVFSKRDVSKVQKDVTAVINPTKKISDLEKKVNFSDTFQNRVDLADAHYHLKNYNKAQQEYTEALKGNHAQDYYVNAQLLLSLYNQDLYEEVLQVAEKLKETKEFQGSQSQFAYGLALSKLNRDTEAEVILKKVDQRYSNYPERLELSKFYLATGKKENAREILTEMQHEFTNLTKPNKKKYRTTFSEVDALVKTL